MKTIKFNDDGGDARLSKYVGLEGYLRAQAGQKAYIRLLDGGNGVDLLVRASQILTTGEMKDPVSPEVRELDRSILHDLNKANVPYGIIPSENILDFIESLKKR